MNDALIFDMMRRLKQRWTGKSVGLIQAEVDEVNAVLKAAKESQPSPSSGLASKAPPLAAIIGTIAATSLLVSVPKEEGMEYKAYRDIVGVWTICAGDTNDVRPGLIETPEGCRQRLERQLVAHAKPVMACTPRLSEPGRDYQRAAAVSLAYNVGVGAWCRSTADKRFDIGDWRGGCDAFRVFSRGTYSKPQPGRDCIKKKSGGYACVILGLKNRRERERAVCLKGLT